MNLVNEILSIHACLAVSQLSNLIGSRFRGFTRHQTVK